jgi:hypothetical protein
MWRRWLPPTFAILATLGCGAAPLSEGASTGSKAAAISSCAPGETLKGASYDVTKSRFAFGSTPVRDDSNGFARWVGKDGVVAITASGWEIGSLDGGAPEASLPAWSADPVAFTAHVRAYLVSFGIDDCQVGDAGVNGGAAETVDLARAVDGIPVSESIAFASIDDADQSTSEGFYWPTVPADVVTAARDLRDRLADPTALAAYKAKLPTAAQGDGQVVIHHTDSTITGPFSAAATYDVPERSELGLGSTASFDADGNPVPATW